MLPSVAPTHPVFQLSPRVQLDARLFVAGSWWCLDAQNRRVPGVVAASLDAALGLIGQGAVATVVGRLVPGVVVVDVDVDGVAGWAIAEHVCAWADRNAVWRLLRPSGGADGRAHVFLAGGNLEDLPDFVASLRDSYGVPSSMVDVRREVRPLSAPHRTGVDTAPLGDVRAAQQALVATLMDAAIAAPSPLPVDDRADVALMPVRRRTRRDLPREWSTYLLTGVAPAFQEGADSSRSAVEHVATVRMVQAGWTAPEAWATIQAAHPEAMQRARESYRRWVRTAWNTAVRRDDAHQPVPTPNDPVAEAVLAARCALLEVAWTLPPKARPGLLTVGHAVLDRMERTNCLRVPVPERNLVLDTGVADRRTIRTQLRRLHAGGVGRLYKDSFVPARHSSSYEFEIPSLADGVSIIDPPSFHTPYAHIHPSSLHGPRHTWTTLRHLPATPTPPTELAQLCLLTDSPTSTATPRQLRTLLQGLHTLQREGLAACTADGLWHRTLAPIPRELLLLDQQQRAPLRATVQAERAAWRSGSSWSRARAAAVKVDRARQRQWWGSLSETERAHRRQEWSEKFAGLSLVDQERVKAHLAQRDQISGVAPDDRRRAWLASLAEGEFAARSQQRAAWFEGLPDPLKIAHATAWARDRARVAQSRLATTSVRRQ